MPAHLVAGVAYSYTARHVLATQVNPDQVAKAGTNPLDDPNCGEHAFASCLASKFEELGCEVRPDHHFPLSPVSSAY